MSMRAVAVKLWLPLAIIYGCALWGFCKPACYPWSDAHGDLVCSEDGKENPRYRWQTISEMVARTGMVSEVFCGVAAVALVGMWSVVRCLSKPGDEVRLAFAIGAVGYIGLTVWSLRVSGAIHTGFTVQTLMMMLLMNVLLIESWCSRAVVACALQGLSLVLYIVLYSSRPAFASYAAAEYFKFKYYHHAVAQSCFIFFHNVTLTILALDYRRSKRGYDPMASCR